MPSSEINFYTEDVLFTLKGKTKIKNWLTASAKKEAHTIESLSYIFCSNAYLLKINQDYLKHDTYTDIITFQHSGDKEAIEGDIFISIDMVKENAGKFGVPFRDELNRVIIHGLLHLCGYKDKNSLQKAEMRKKEDYYLKRLSLET